MVMTRERPHMWTTQQLAEHLQVSERTILNWIRSGRLSGYRLPGSRAGWRIDDAALERFLAALRGQVPQETEA